MNKGGFDKRIEEKKGVRVSRNGRFIEGLKTRSKLINL